MRPPVQVGAARATAQQQHTPRHLPIGKDFPPTLPPPPPLSHEDRASPYGLSTLQLSGLAHLQQEVHALRAWCTDGIRLDRDIKYTAVQQETWEATNKIINSYLGFCHKHHGYQGLELSLDLFGDPFTYSHFVSFHMARGTGCLHLRNILSHSRKVVAWLSSTRPTLKTHFHRVDQWMELLSRQAPFAAPSTKRTYNLPTAKDLLLFQAKHVEAKANRLWEDVLLHSDPQLPLLMPKPCARACMDAAMLSLMFGYFPPLRLACIRTCIHPDHVGGPCMDPDCPQPTTCQGNRLEWTAGRPQLADLSTPAQPTLKAVFPHHKNARRWDGFVISFQLPPALCCTLHPHILHGHATLTPATAPAATLLFTNQQGRELSEANLCQWFNKLLEEGGGAPFPTFPPSKLRHIFVEERQSDQAAPGPSNRAAARIMGNSERVWDTHYDRHFSQREVDAAVGAMAQWRDTHLTQQE